MTRWKITLHEGGFVIDATNEAEARTEALECLAESLDLFVVEEVVELASPGGAG